MKVKEEVENTSGISEEGLARIDTACQYYESGSYNCAQSVIVAYSEVLQGDKDLLFILSEGLGAGMGGLDGICGPVTAMFMIAGKTTSGGRSSTVPTNAKTYALVRTLADEFIEKNHSIYCVDILSGRDGVPFRSCAGCIIDACIILEKSLFNEEKLTF